jgi:hypothetical protein
MDSAIGNDIEMTDEFIPEEDLQTYVRTWKDREKRSTSKTALKSLTMRLCSLNLLPRASARR